MELEVLQPMRPLITLRHPWLLILPQFTLLQFKLTRHQFTLALFPLMVSLKARIEAEWIVSIRHCTLYLIIVVS